MAVHYHLVLRKDMTKGAAEDSKLYYAQTSASGMNDLKQMCENIAARTTASGVSYPRKSWLAESIEYVEIYK